MLKSRVSHKGTPVEELTRGSEQKVTLVCDDCGKETLTAWSNYVQGQEKRNFSGETQCQPCTARSYGKRNKGNKCPSVSAANKQRRGEHHPSWKGGRYLAHDGYVMVSVRSGRNDKSGWNNYRKEHLVVVEQHIGRGLEAGEVVHHIDGKKTNNAFSNLWLTDSQGHREAHASLQQLGYEAIRAGLITFDRDTGEYVANVKLRELLGHPEEGNQQPSLGGNSSEGSETNSHGPNVKSRAMKGHERGAPKGDDIVRAACITEKDAELPDKEPVG